MKIFYENNMKHELSECTAIPAFFWGNESERTSAILVKSIPIDNDNNYTGENIESFIVFNWDMPENIDDFVDMLNDSQSWELTTESHKVE